MDIQNSPTYQRIYSPSNETKLCIIIDSRTPILTKVPVAPGRLTLKQFKTYAGLNDNCYKFYFKSHDSEFGTVKEELVDDDSILPVEDGRIVVWVITTDFCQSTLFESDKVGSDSRVNGRSPQPLRQSPIGYGYGYSPNHLNKSTARLDQEHVYDQMIIDQPSCILANFFLEPHDTLGLTVLCPSDEINGYTGGLLINRVQPNSVASRDGRVCARDKIVEINGVDLRGIRTGEAIRIFKELVENKGAINLVLHKNDRPFSEPLHDQHLINTNNHQPPKPRTTVNGFDPATELPAPVIEPDQMIATTPRTNYKTNSSRSTYSLPRSLTPRSLYTTSNLDNLTSCNDLRLHHDSRSVYEPTTPNSLSIALHCSKDIYIIYASLKSDSASLDIKDREWLKVVVKDAFLGSTLVKWLSRNVYGFCNRSEVKRYANRMLSIGLIESPMSNPTFSEKCYYTLT